MRRIIKLTAASLAVVIAYVVGNVAFAQPASATFCVPIAARGSISYSISTSGTSSTSGESLTSSTSTTSTTSSTDAVDPTALPVDSTDLATVRFMPDPPDPMLLICGPIIQIHTN